jgi:hypothetical protein
LNSDAVQSFVQTISLLGVLMRIATWNLESYRVLTPERTALFQRAMGEIKADIWVLTETWRGFSPGHDYILLAESSEASDLVKWPKRCWVTIWVKSPVGRLSQEVCNEPERMARGRIEISEMHDIVIVGTVLPWGSDGRFPGATGFCDAVREQESDWTLRAVINNECAYIVAGDFNQSLPYQQGYGSKAGADILNEVLEKHGLDCLTRTKNPLPDVPPAIDHICVRQSSAAAKTVPVVETWATPTLEGKPITDHCGTFVDIEV